MTSPTAIATTNGLLTNRPAQVGPKTKTKNINRYIE